MKNPNQLKTTNRLTGTVLSVANGVATLPGGAALALLFASAFVAQAEVKFYTNVVMMQFYDNIPGGGALSNLTSSPKFPNSPDRVVFAPIPEIPINAADNYGVRITGVLIPVFPDAYYLVMCSDDQGELYLSSDTNAANKVLIAREPEWNPSRAWSSTARRPDTARIDPLQPPNVSVQVFTEGQQRYFELLMKEGTGDDNLALTTAPEFGLTIPADGTPPDFQYFGLGVFADDVPKVLSGPRLKRGSAVAGQETVLTAAYYAPPGATSYQWFRNGTAITGATDAEYTFTPAPGDAGARYQVEVTVDGKSGRSPEMVLLFDAFSPGLAKLELFFGISGTAVDALTASAKYQANTPDEVRFVAATSTPAGIADNYGARLSFSFVPAQSGNYTFFTRSDDLSRIFLSTDGTLDVTTATQLAEATACCLAFQEPPSPAASAPQALTGGERYFMFGLMKEGTGGDFFQIAMRQEGDPTPAARLRPIGGSLIGTLANGTGVGLSVAQNPASTNIVEGQTAVFDASGVATPVGTPVAYQWQRNGVDIPGASGSRLVLTNVPLSEDNTTYRAVIGTLGGIQQTTSAATLDVVPDTFPPEPRVAALRTAGGEFQVSVTFDEQVQDAAASDQGNYAVSPGTISSFTYWTYDQGAVLGLSGVQAGQTVSVSVRNVSDLKGNSLTTPVTNSVTLANLLSWTGIGGDQFNTERMTTAYSDGAVALGPKDFDLISGGHQYWENYDEATFVYEQITGDFDRAVRVEYQDPTSEWARSGLQVREALDSGVTRGEITGGYQFSRNFTVRVNPVVQCSGSPGNNAYEVIHRPMTGGAYNQNNIQNLFGGAPNYPTAWMRLRRVGQTMEAYKSDDGITWIGPATATYTNDPATPDVDEGLINTVYVGMFYAPEMNNNTPITADCTGGSRVAKFRDYGPFGGGGGGGPTIGIARPGTVTFSDTLQSATSITGRWDNVQGAVSPYTIPAGTTTRFYRSCRQAGQTPVALGAATTFAVLAGSTVTSTGATTVNGDLGLSPGTAVAGFPPGTVNGTIHAGDPAAAQAQLDLTTAYNDAAGRTVGAITIAGNLGGQTLTPGLYKSTSSLEISSGDLTLDAQGDANAVFIFQMASTLTTTVGRQVILSGGAKAANVFWQVGSSATLGTGSVFKGNILASASITVTTGATVEGRLLARTGAVTLDANTITIPAP